MARQGQLRKVIDDETRFRCGDGVGILREEVWVNEKVEVVKYNLAFLLPHLARADNGRILGYDNAHGIHERHFKGEVKPVSYKGYAATSKRFHREANDIRRSYEN